MDGLGKVGVNALLVVLLCLLLGLLEDELRYVAVEVFVRYGRGKCRTHLGTYETGYNRGEGAVCHSCVVQTRMRTTSRRPGA